MNNETIDLNGPPHPPPPPILYRNDKFAQAKKQRGRYAGGLRHISKTTGLSINAIRGAIAGRPVELSTLWILAEYFGIYFPDLFARPNIANSLAAGETEHEKDQVALLCIRCHQKLDEATGPDVHQRMHDKITDIINNRQSRQH